MTEYNPGAALVNLYARFRRRGNLLILLTIVAVLVLALLTPASRTRLPIPLPANKLGVHLLLDDGRNRWPPAVWPEHLRYAAQAVGEWGFVTQLIRADDLDPAKWQTFMDLCAEYQLTPIIRLATTFDRTNRWWNAPTPDTDGAYQTLARQYADFLAELTWPTDLHYIIVGNEPNHGNEWSGTPDANAYAKWLIDTAQAVHAADPQARVLNAALDAYAPNTNGQPFVDGMAYMDTESFMDAMIAAQPAVFTHLDAWATHPYAPNFSAPPAEQTFQIDYLNGAANPGHRQPPANIFNRGVNSYEWELWKLSTYGIRPLPVFITETGWRHAESTHPDALDFQENLPDAAVVATYLDLALRGNNEGYADLPTSGWKPWLNDARVFAVTPFAFGGLPATWGHSNWLQLDNTGAVLDTYPMFDLLASISQEE